MIRKGEQWGKPATSGPDYELAVADRALALAVQRDPGCLVRFVPDPDSDLARAVGLTGREQVTTEVALDALASSTPEGDLWAVNMVVVGPPPDRLRRSSRRVHLRIEVDGREWFAGKATTVVVATGQFLRGLDLIPRGHPGDGRAELQAYRLRPGERAPMRRRLADGSHVPHPRIEQRSGRLVRVQATRPLRLESDGVPLAPVRELRIEVVASAYRLLV